MIEIKLEKRYPHSRTEDITDAFMRGYQQGKDDEHRWWSNHCANCKDAEQTEPSNSEKPNNCDEPQTDEDCDYCKMTHKYWYEHCDICKRKPKDEPQTDCDHRCVQTEIGCEKPDCPWK